MKILKNRLYLISYGLAIFTFTIFSYSHANGSGKNFPTTKWQTSAPEEQGMQSHVLAQMLEHIKDKSLQIESISIVRNGYMVMDAYFWPFLKTRKHIIHSCTKSIMSALIGIAIDKGYIKSVNQPITDFFSDKTVAKMDELKQSITLENLLMMASGLKCQDSYLYGWKGLFAMRSSPNWAQYVLELPMAEPPGEKFEYCNGVSYLLSVIIQNTTKMRTLEFATKYLFRPIGISDIGWAKSPQGIDIGYGEMHLRPSDMVRFGWLFLNKGRWDSKQIIPSAWVEKSTQGHIDATLFDQYGYQWWIDSKGYYAAVGYKGQRIFIIPEKNMVAVFTGDLTGRESLMAKKLFENYIIPAASSPEKLPPNTKDQVRLNSLVSGAAKAPLAGLSWISKNKGAAKDGVFTRTTAPAFTFKYPLGSKKSAINSSGQVMRMKTPLDIDFSASVGKAPEDIKLKNFGPKFYAQGLENLGSNIKVIANREITLHCGTKAYKTDITWLWKNSFPITTLLVSAYKDDKFVFVCAHSWKNYYSAVPIVLSLSFK
ncbi:MAG: serine hydrolase [Deltaproteobacteria bacterium]|jgi:CubicO group peptidase (beta-lactamase class C family)|nr:serine hydrolase [Deltaproteobacteria bacterium]